MTRAEGASLWRMDGEAESNAHDSIEVTPERVVWRVRAFASAESVQLAAEDPAARRFMSRVLAEKRRIAQRSIVRPAPKPERVRRRPAVAGPVECPRCGGGGPIDCPCCGGEGWVAAAAAERCR